MLIELQEPFRSQWNQGYLRIEESGRRYLSLYKGPGNQTSISYARYLMCVHLGYIILPELEVDHINDNCTDDRIENLQVLTKEQNLLKQKLKQFEEQVVYGYSCANNCGTYFTLTEREIKMRLNQGVEMAFCSRSCAASYGHAKRTFLANYTS